MGGGGGSGSEGAETRRCHGEHLKRVMVEWGTGCLLGPSERGISPVICQEEHCRQKKQQLGWV